MTAATSEQDGLPLAAEADQVDRAAMARNPVPRSNVAVAIIVAFALLIVAIIVRNFWLSLIFGTASTVTFAYAVFLLREYRKNLPNDEKGAP